MKRGSDKIIECPKCGALAKHFTQISGNTFGAILWTDGKFEACMLRRLPLITKCYTCHGYYWLSQAKEIGIVPFWGSQREENQRPEAWKNAPHIKTPTEDEYWEALETNVATDENQRLNLRVAAWQAANDVHRNEQCKKGGEVDTRTCFSVKAKENLEKLYESLTSEDAENRLVKAEAARELGRFDDAIKLLANDVSEHKAAYISELARGCVSIVRIVPRLE